MGGGPYALMWQLTKNEERKVGLCLASSVATRLLGSDLQVVVECSPFPAKVLCDIS